MSHAAVFDLARRHHITAAEARRVLVAMDRARAAKRKRAGTPDATTEEQR